MTLEDVANNLQKVLERVTVLEQGLTDWEKRELSYALFSAKGGYDDKVESRLESMSEFLDLLAKKLGVTSDYWRMP